MVMHATWEEHIESISDDDKGILPTERQAQTDLANVGEETRGGTFFRASSLRVIRMGTIWLILVTILCPSVAFAQYVHASAKVCNYGEIDLVVIGGEANTSGLLFNNKRKAIGYYKVDRGDCTYIEFTHDRSFNLAFLSFLNNGEAGYVRLDATNGEILYKNPTEWSKSKLNTNNRADYARSGGNADGRTCASNDGQAFSVELSSWNGDDPCPSGYYAVALSNWIRVAYESRSVEVYLYPKRRHWQPMEGGATQGRAQSTAANTPEGAAINELLAGTACNRISTAWVRYRDPVVFSIGATGAVTYIWDNYSKGVLTKQSTHQWSLSDIERAELRTGNKCAVLNLVCKNDRDCVRQEGGRDKDNVWLYFADMDRAEEAKAILKTLGIR